jgi:hypothetical protein
MCKIGNIGFGRIGTYVVKVIIFLCSVTVLTIAFVVVVNLVSKTLTGSEYILSPKEPILAELPDGIFSNQSLILVNFGGSCNGRCLYILWSFGIFCGHLVYFLVNWYILWPFGIFCGHLVYFVAIWYILWPFGILCGHLVYFSRLGMLHRENSGSPALG